MLPFERWSFTFTSPPLNTEWLSQLHLLLCSLPLALVKWVQNSCHIFTWLNCLQSELTIVLRATWLHCSEKPVNSGFSNFIFISAFNSVKTHPIVVPIISSRPPVNRHAWHAHTWGRPLVIHQRSYLCWMLLEAWPRIVGLVAGVRIWAPEFIGTGTSY